MKTLRRIWDDIRAGDNIDQYVTIVAAIVLVILNLFGTAWQPYLAPMTLAILALLAINGLGNRHRIEELMQQKSQTVDTFFTEGVPAGYMADFERASVLWLYGVSLHRTIKTNYPILEKKLQQGQSMRVLVVKPEGVGIDLAVARNYAHRGVQPKSQEISLVLELLTTLRTLAPDKVEIRTIDFPLAYGVTAVNPKAASGRLYIEHYGFRVATDAKPRFVLNAADGKWYDFYLREIETLWDAGTVWSGEKASS